MAEAKWKPTITVEGAEIDFNPTPRLLGIILDRQLSFNPQLQEATECASKKLNMLAAVAHSEWGWPKDSLRMMYNSFARNKMDYASPAWQPWLSDSNMLKLESVQNRALRLITGQFKSTPVEALRAEAEVPSYKTHSDRQCLKSMEKAKRLPADHPRKIALDGAVKAKNLRTSWFTKGEHLSKGLDEVDLSPICFFGAPPWINYQVEVFDELPGVTSREVDIDIRRNAAITRIKEFNADVTIYTDGSATAGTHHGGAGAVITVGDPESPRCIDEIKQKGAPYTSSYEEEHFAMRSALEWIVEHGEDYSSVLICTDSQSLCKALLGHGTDTDELKLLLAACNPSISIQWIPGHSDIPGNELADQSAKDAAKLSGTGRGVSYRGIVPAINSTISDPAISHIRTRNVYKEYTKTREKEISSRKEKVSLARARSGHHMGFRQYQHRLNPEIDPTCKRCQNAEDNLEHWLSCEALMHVRQQIFGETELQECVLTAKPRLSSIYALRTLNDTG